VKVHEVREKVAVLLAERDQHLREQIAKGRELQAILDENKRFYAYEVQPPLPGTDYTPRFNVEFSGDPEAPVMVQGNHLSVLTLERLKTLTEIVEHVELWKDGTIETLAPSGVWADVKPPKPRCTCGADYDGLPGTETAGSERCPYTKHHTSASPSS
jgi:hypothetical protein